MHHHWCTSEGPLARAGCAGFDTAPGLQQFYHCVFLLCTLCCTVGFKASRWGNGTAHITTHAQDADPLEIYKVQITERDPEARGPAHGARGRDAAHRGRAVRRARRRCSGESGKACRPTEGSRTATCPQQPGAILVCAEPAVENTAWARIQRSCCALLLWLAVMPRRLLLGETPSSRAFLCKPSSAHRWQPSAQLEKALRAS